MKDMQRIGSISKRRNSKPSSTSSGSLPSKLKSNKPPQHTITYYDNTNNDPTKQDKADAIKRSYKKQSSTFSFNRGRANSNGGKGSSGGGKSGRSSSRGPMKQISNNLRSSSSKSKTKPSKVKKEATA